MECDSCESGRVASLSGKCSDMFGLDMGDLTVENDYVPGDFGIGGGDYIQFAYCLDCGKIQGDFPLEETELEVGGIDKEDDEESDDWSDDDIE